MACCVKVVKNALVTLVINLTCSEYEKALDRVVNFYIVGYSNMCQTDGPMDSYPVSHIIAPSACLICMSKIHFVKLFGLMVMTHNNT